MPAFISKQEALEHLRKQLKWPTLCSKTIDNWIKSGRLEGSRVIQAGSSPVRITAESIERLIKGEQ